MEKNNKVQELLEKLSPIERKIIPYLNLSPDEILKKAELDAVSLNHTLKFLENKGVLQVKTKNYELIELATNGIYYKKNHLPERNLIIFLDMHNRISIKDAEKQSKLSNNEFKVSLGILKNKGIISLNKVIIILNASKEELTKKFPEEKLIELLPIEKAKLSPEHLPTFENLRRRKDIINTRNCQHIDFELTELGKQIAGEKLEINLIEEVTSNIILNGTNGKKFRKYDIYANAPKLYGGKKHFLSQSIEYAKKIWLEMGFKEMKGPIVDTSFWVFDSLFTPQDHPDRDMQDTFFLKNQEGKLPNTKLIQRVKEVHEGGYAGSTGWKYKWDEEESKKVVLRTHTTSISARTLANLKESDFPVKYFSIGKVFRNETIDWSHGFEFSQSEGIVADENMNFRNLLGFLKEFYKKMGFEKIRFRPSYFAYTEPSVEIEIFHPEKKEWIELGGAGMLRPEVTFALIGKEIPILAWGQGLDRIIMDFYKIKDIREIHSTNLKILREKKFWTK